MEKDELLKEYEAERYALRRRIFAFVAMILCVLSVTLLSSGIVYAVPGDPSTHPYQPPTTTETGTGNTGNTGAKSPTATSEIDKQTNPEKTGQDDKVKAAEEDVHKNDNADALPEPNYNLTDWIGNLNKFISYQLVSSARGHFREYDSLVSQSTGNNRYGQTYQKSLGGTVYNIVEKVHKGAVVPIAESILALFMLVQLVKISQRIDATATLPAVKDVVFLAVTYVLMHWFIKNSLDIMNSVYNIFASQIIPHIVGDNPAESLLADSLGFDKITAESWDSIDCGNCILLWLASLLVMFGGAITNIVSFILVFARQWQMMAYGAFSSIPMALLGFEETRSMGVNFLKNFASVCLANAVAVFLIVSFPRVMTTASAATVGAAAAVGAGNYIVSVLGVATSGGATAAVGALTMLAPTIGICALYAYALIKSGSWARDILGG